MARQSSLVISNGTIIMLLSEVQDTFLPRFRRLCGRAKRTERRRQARGSIREGAAGQLPHVFNEIVAPEKLTLPKGARNRAFDTLTTFWTSLAQVFSQGSPRDGLQLVQSCRARQGHGSASPQMALKELHLHLIAYNLLRFQMLQVAGLCDLPGTVRGESAWVEVHSGRVTALLDWMLLDYSRE